MANIRFVEDKHFYHDEEGNHLISVSKFTERFKEKLDWNAIAKRSAAKATREGTPTTTADILKKWEIKRDKSAEIGTLFHSIREKELIESINPEFYNQICKQKAPIVIAGDKYSMPLTEIENNTVYPELMIYDTEHMICGQSDKVIIVDNTIHIWDYKTDLEISFSAFSSQWVKPRKLLEPISHLEDCNGNLYSIKMSLYMYMLWKANKGKFKTGDIIIEHVHLKRDPDNDNIPVLENGQPVVLKIDQIKLPYRKKEVMDMLATLKNQYDT